VIEFRALTESDLPELHEWLQREHVRRWWHDTSTYEETVDRYGPALRGEEPTSHYVIVFDGRDVGMIETYLVSDYREWEAIVQEGDRAAGVDLLIGEESLIGRGLGPEILRSFVGDIVVAPICVASVDCENRRSLRAFEKAGFRYVRDIEEDGRPHRLMRLVRAN
jgi:aminoglycoside 6'-N-acetyltransferase